jgi:hypothetical protein
MLFYQNNTKNTTNTFTNIFKFQSYLAVIGISSLLFSCFNLPTVNAGTGNWSGSQFMIVTSLRGINVRDKKCNIITRVGAGEILEKGSQNPTQIKCKIGETEMSFVNYWLNSVKTTSTEQFVAVNFIQNIIMDSGVRNKKLNLVIKNEMGANLRNTDCQKVLRVPNKTVSSKDIIITGDGKNVCKVGEEFYMMENFIHQNRNYQVAEVLTKYE